MTAAPFPSPEGSAEIAFADFLGSPSSKGSRIEVDLSTQESDAQRVIRGAYLRAVLLALPEKGEASSLAFTGAILTGDLDLAGTDIRASLHFKQSCLRKVILTDAKVLGLQLDSTSVEALWADRATFGGSLIARSIMRSTD